MTDRLKVRFVDELRGVVIPFRPRLRDAVEIKNVKRVWPLDDPVQYAMDDDTAPCERNPDPFEADQLETNAKA